ncbi:MAG: DUF455 family protein [Planctomycetes bacterium]|nr:DUF455 family protein [Planctomycetota bacterium]
MSYPDGLLAAIRAGEAAEKDAILAALAPPADGSVWDMPALPERPGRPAGVVEGEASRRRRGICTPGGLRRFLHAIWHIEYEAVDLACVLALRGSGMPAAFHADCLRVAREEVAHAGMVARWLRDAGYPPGSEPVHHRLWEAARACTDLGEQLVVVPRFLEARGLDVNAGLLPTLRDASAHAVLARIYRDEIGHVATGTRWHRTWCAERGLDAEEHFAQVVRARFAGEAGPWQLDRDGRMQAGFSEAELAVLSATPPRA